MVDWLSRRRAPHPWTIELDPTTLPLNAKREALIEASEFRFLVQGSAEEPYTVRFRFKDWNCTTLCTCPAGENRLQCKHRINLLLGVVDNVVSGNEDDITRMRELIAGTDVEECLNALIAAEQALVEAKSARKKAATTLAEAMMD